MRGTHQHPDRASPSGNKDTSHSHELAKPRSIVRKAHGEQNKQA